MVDGGWWVQVGMWVYRVEHVHNVEDFLIIRSRVATNQIKHLRLAGWGSRLVGKLVRWSGAILFLMLTGWLRRADGAVVGTLR